MPRGDGAARRRRLRLAAGPRARGKTLPATRLAPEEVEAGKGLELPIVARPRSRDDCVDGERPCPWVSCKYHLFVDVNPHTGSMKFNHPGREPWELLQTCALDVADRGGVVLDEVALFVNLTKERVRQIEVDGLEKIHGELERDA